MIDIRLVHTESNYKGQSKGGLDDEIFIVLLYHEMVSADDTVYWKKEKLKSCVESKIGHLFLFSLNAKNVYIDNQNNVQKCLCT